MTRLEDALQALALRGEVTHAGRWVRLHGVRGAVYVVEAGGGYYTWCEPPATRVVQFYPDPEEALRSGLRRADGPDEEVRRPEA